MINQNKSAKRTQNASQRLAEFLEIFLIPGMLLLDLYSQRKKIFKHSKIGMIFFA